MKLLGLSFDYHDSAAALVVDGKLVSAMQEERLSRVKHDNRLPSRAIKHCLVAGDVRADEVDAVIYYEEPFRKFERIARSSLFRSPRWLKESFQDWVAHGKFEVSRRIAEETGINQSRILFCKHHCAHAGAAFFCSPFEEATIVTIDGIGEFETASISVGYDNKVKRLSSVRFPHSIGLAYSAYTAHLGFEVNEGEYKVMGMAAYGSPTRVDDVRKTLFAHQGSFRVSPKHLNFATASESPFTASFTKLFGSAREPESPFATEESGEASSELVFRSRHYADIAASIQAVTEELVLEYVSSAISRTGVRNVAMSGGVALNSLAIGRLTRELGVPLYVHPAAGDAGAAVGAALWHHCANLGLQRPPALESIYLGGCYGDEEIERALKIAGFSTQYRHVPGLQLIEAAAELLGAGKVIGWFQGRSEWGPRALGARSILSAPHPGEMKGLINNKVKFREPFRPFAPAVLAERAHDYFDVPPANRITQPESYMLSIARVRDEKRSAIPAVTHADGTARLQLVWSEPRSSFRCLIEAYAERSGIPVVLNTSFNRRGEPIVETPDDALRTFSWTGLDAVFLGNFVVTKGAA